MLRRSRCSCLLRHAAAPSPPQNPIPSQPSPITHHAPAAAPTLRGSARRWFLSPRLPPRRLWTAPATAPPSSELPCPAAGSAQTACSAMRPSPVLQCTVHGMQVIWQVQAKVVSVCAMTIARRPLPTSCAGQRSTFPPPRKAAGPKQGIHSRTPAHLLRLFPVDVSRHGRQDADL